MEGRAQDIFGLLDGPSNAALVTKLVGYELMISGYARVSGGGGYTLIPPGAVREFRRNTVSTDNQIIHQ